MGRRRRNGNTPVPCAWQLHIIKHDEDLKRGSLGKLEYAAAYSCRREQRWVPTTRYNDVPFLWLQWHSYSIAPSWAGSLPDSRLWIGSRWKSSSCEACRFAAALGRGRGTRRPEIIGQRSAAGGRIESFPWTGDTIPGAGKGWCVNRTHRTRLARGGREIWRCGACSIPEARADRPGDLDEGVVGGRRGAAWWRWGELHLGDHAVLHHDHAAVAPFYQHLQDAVAQARGEDPVEPPEAARPGNTMRSSASNMGGAPLRIRRASW